MITTARLLETTPERIRRHVGSLARLAWPVMLSRAGILMMAFSDIAMLGRYQEGAVGIANLGISIFIPLLVISIGLCTGIVPVVSQAYGAGLWAECGRVWRRGLIWGLAISGPGILLCWQGEALLVAFGQEPTFAIGGGAVARALAPGLPAQVIFAVSAFYLEATGRPKTALVVMIFANIANVFLNWLMIYGHWGVPEMGAVGAALASTIVRFGAAAALIWMILTQAGALRAGVIGRWRSFWGPGGWAAGDMMRKLGYSAGISNGFETVGFGAMTMFAGTLGTLPLDAYSISHNMVSTAFMVGLGLAIATGVRVGTETGAGRPDEAAFAGWTGLVLSIAVMGTIGGLIWFGRDQVVWIYTDDPDIAARAAALFAVAALVFVPDSAQVVLGQALRGLSDAWPVVLIYILAFVVLMVPLGWVLVDRAGFDERGLVLAIIVSCVLATGLLAWRFRALTCLGATARPWA